MAVRKTRGPGSGPHVQKKGNGKNCLNRMNGKFFATPFFLFKCCVVCNQFKFKICFSHQSHFQRQNPKKKIDSPATSHGCSLLVLDVFIESRFECCPAGIIEIYCHGSSGGKINCSEVGRDSLKRALCLCVRVSH